MRCSPEDPRVDSIYQRVCSPVKCDIEDALPRVLRAVRSLESSMAYGARLLSASARGVRSGLGGISPCVRRTTPIRHSVTVNAWKIANCGKICTNLTTRCTQARDDHSYGQRARTLRSLESIARLASGATVRGLGAASSRHAAENCSARDALARGVPGPAAPRGAPPGGRGLVRAPGGLRGSRSSQHGAIH